MPILRHLDREAKQWILNGRLIAVPLTGPVRPEVPEWLAALVRARAQRFDYGLTLSPLEALRLWGLPGWDRWGSAGEMFVSETIPRDDQRIVTHIAEQLQLACAYSPWTSRFVFAPQGTWR